MSHPNQNPAASPLRGDAAGALALLLHLARHEQTREIAAAGASIFALAGAASLGVVAADHVVPGGLSAGWRTGLLVALIAGALIGAASAIVRTIGRRVSLAYVAQQAERAGGIRHNALVNAVLVGTNPSAAYARSAALSQADAALPNAPASLPAARGAARPWLLAAAVVVGWAAYAALSPKSVGVSVQRMLGADLPAPTATAIRLVRPSPDDVVRVGAALEIEFELTGAPADHVVLAVRAATAADAPDETIGPPRRSRSPDGNDRRTFSLAPFQVQRDLAFRCTAGDATITGVIPVHPAPMLESVAVTLTPPPYTRRQPLEAAGLDITALAGTKAQFHLVANQPLRQAVLVTNDGTRETRTRFKVRDDGTPRATLDLPLTTSATFAFELTDAYGMTVACNDTGRITVLADEPPQFLATYTAGRPPDAPFLQHVAFDGAWPTIEAVAVDDVAIERAWLVVQTGETPTRLPLELRRAEDGGPVTLSANLDSLLNRTRHETSIWFEAEDGRILPDGRAASQTGASPVIQLGEPERPASAQNPPRPDSTDTTPVPEPTSAPAFDPPASADAENTSDERDTATEPEAPPQAAETPQDSPAAGEQPGEEAIDEFIRDHGQEAAEADRVRRGESNQPNAQRGESEGQTGAGEPAPAGEPPDTTGVDGGAAQGRESSAGEPREAGDRGDSVQPGANESEPGVAPGPGSQGGARQAIVDLIEAAERGEEVTSDELVRAGWPEAKADAFIRNLTHLHARLRARGGVEALRTRVLQRDEAAEVLPGQAVTRDAVSVQQVESWRDELRSLAPPPGETVAEDLRPLLDAYYRAVAEAASRPARR